MSKLKLSLVALCFSVLTSAAFAEARIGLSGAYMSFSGTGSETLRQSNAVTNYDESEDVIVPSLFFEIVGDTGFGLGLDYVPVAELGSGVGADDDDAETSGNNDVSAEFTSHLTVYGIKEMSNGTYAKFGMVFADIDTTEKLSTGDTYPNADTTGFMIGVGKNFSNNNGTFFRGDLSYTNYDEVSITSTGGSKVKADIESIGATISVGKAF